MEVVSTGALYETHVAAGIHHIGGTRHRRAGQQPLLAACQFQLGRIAVGIQPRSAYRDDHVGIIPRQGVTEERRGRRPVLGPHAQAKIAVAHQ